MAQPESRRPRPCGEHTGLRRAPTGCSLEPRDAGRRSPSKLSLAGQGRRTHDLPRVETLKLGPWTLQGACKSTVTQSTMEGPLESVSAAFSFGGGPRAKKGRAHCPRGWDPSPVMKQLREVMTLLYFLKILTLIIYHISDPI